MRSEPVTSEPAAPPGRVRAAHPVRPADRLAASKALRFASPSAIPDGTGLDTPCRPALARGVLNPNQRRRQMSPSTDAIDLPHPHSFATYVRPGRADRHDVQPANAPAQASRRSNVGSVEARAAAGTANPLGSGPRRTAPTRRRWIRARCRAWGQSKLEASPPALVRARRRQAVGGGQRTELARYDVNGGERVLYGQRINGCVRITDRPAAGPGRSYLVERELRAGRLLGAEGARGRLHRAISRAGRGSDGEQRDQIAA